MSATKQQIAARVFSRYAGQRPIGDADVEDIPEEERDAYYSVLGDGGGSDSRMLAARRERQAELRPGPDYEAMKEKFAHLLQANGVKSNSATGLKAQFWYLHGVYSAHGIEMPAAAGICIAAGRPMLSL